MTLDVALVSPERVLFHDPAEMVICRTTDGELAFLTGHAPFVGALGIAIVRIRKEDGTEQKAAVHGGFVEVRDDQVSILSDVAELPEQIDVDRARRAMQQAERRLAQGDDPEAAAAARRAEIRLELVGRAP